MKTLVEALQEFNIQPRECVEWKRKATVEAIGALVEEDIFSFSSSSSSNDEPTIVLKKIKMASRKSINELAVHTRDAVKRKRDTEGGSRKHKDIMAKNI